MAWDDDMKLVADNLRITKPEIRTLPDLLGFPIRTIGGISDL